MSQSATTPPGRNTCEHVGELLSWHANGTLNATDRALVDAHAGVCSSCRTALALERRIVESMRAPRDNVENSPHAGWQKLAARIEHEAKSAPPVTGAPPLHKVPRSRRYRLTTLAAAVAVQAAVIAVLAVALVRYKQADEAPRFHTLASGDATLAAKGPLVRIAFDSTVDEPSARAVAEEAGGHILAGPSPDNVYTFVFPTTIDSGAGLEAKVSDLRHQAHVLLVEPVILGKQPEKE